MELIDVRKQVQTEDQCLDYLQHMRWPDGQIGCVHCGEIWPPVQDHAREKEQESAHPYL